MAIAQNDIEVAEQAIKVTFSENIGFVLIKLDRGEKRGLEGFKSSLTRKKAQFSFLLWVHLVTKIKEHIESSVIRRDLFVLAIVEIGSERNCRHHSEFYRAAKHKHQVVHFFLLRVVKSKHHLHYVV